MKPRLLFISLCSLVVMSGCSAVSQGPVGNHDVKWYVSHAKLMRKQLAWCDNDSDRESLDSCKNATAAMNINAEKAALGSNVMMSPKGPTPAQIFDNYHP